MRTSEVIPKIGSYSLPVQCALLCAALPAIAFKLGPVAGWVFAASLVAGLLAFASGVAATIILRRPRWLVLSAAAIFIAFFSLLLGMSLGGYPAV